MMHNRSTRNIGRKSTSWEKVDDKATTKTPHNVRSQCPREGVHRDGTVATRDLAHDERRDGTRCPRAGRQHRRREWSSTERERAELKCHGLHDRRLIKCRESHTELRRQTPAARRSHCRRQLVKKSQKDEMATVTHSQEEIARRLREQS